MAEIVTTTTQQNATNAPWSVQTPYLQRGFRRAGRLFNRPMQYFPESTVAAMGQPTTNAINDIIGQSQNNPYLAGATNYFNQSVGGGFLPTPDNQASIGMGGMQPGTNTPMAPSMASGNPYLDAMYNAATSATTRNFTQNVVPGLGAKFGMSGRSGSPGMMNALQSAATGYGEGMGNIAADLYGTAYENERQRQQQMAMFAPELMNAQLGSSAAGLEASQLMDEQRQRELSDQVARFQFQQEEPWKRLERYMGNIGGRYGGTSSSTTTGQQPIFEPETWQQILGGVTALGGSGAFGSNGWLGGLLDAGLEFGGNAADWFGNLFNP